ncbi:MAG: hypothetical protein AAB548_01970 [Patescibacteria group bacterium]
MLNKRVQVLFEEKDFVSLVKIARVEDSSVGELVRKAVKKTYLDGRERELALRKKTFEELKVWQEKIGISKTPIDYKELVSYGRKW